MKTLVLTDSAGAMTSAEARSLGIGWLPLQIFLDGRQFLDGVDLTCLQLYRALKQGMQPSTAQPPLVLIQSVLTSARRAGFTDLITINLADSMSSTARVIETTARSIGLQVHRFDLCSSQAVQYYLALAAGQLVRKNMDPAEIISLLHDASRHASSWLIVSDLNYLMNGGRLIPVRSRLSALLGIRPILEISPETGGLVKLRDKARTFSRALDIAIERTAQQIDPEKEYEFFISTSRGKEDVAAAMVRLRQRFGPDISIHILEMSSLVTCHIGTGSLAIQYVGKVPGVQMPSQIMLHPQIMSDDTLQ